MNKNFKMRFNVDAKSKHETLEFFDGKEWQVVERYCPPPPPPSQYLIDEVNLLRILKSLSYVTTIGWENDEVFFNNLAWSDLKYTLEAHKYKSTQEGKSK